MNAVERIGQYLKFGSVYVLDRMTELLARLGNPEKKLRIIHVAGTNGKGSVCRYLYEILEEAGYKTGLYTSPYIEVFNERIELDHELIPEDDLEFFTDRVIRAAEEMVGDGFDSPTEFDIVTAIMFLYFAEKGCDFAVVEVGLGGSLDSTNVIEKPLCSVITSISMDHTAVLGNTIPEIASVKAGIIKAGCPAVIFTGRDDATAVMEQKARECGSPLIDASRIRADILEESCLGTTFTAKIPGLEEQKFRISMPGRHQVDNAVTALAALAVLMERGEAEVTSESILRGLVKARQKGRFEVIREEGPLTVLDGAHNPGGAQALRKAADNFFAGKRVLMLTGILKDKAVDEVLDQFFGITDSFIVTEPPNPRKLPAGALAEKIRNLGGTAVEAPDNEEAVRLAAKLAPEYDILLAAGSLYLIGNIRKPMIQAFGEE